jgi:type VI protein secretion system component Hcp
MRKLNATLVIAIAFVLAAPCIALPASLTYKEIKYDYKQQDNKGTSARDAASGLPTGKRMHKPITITKEADKASPTLMQHTVKGSHIKNANITVRKAGKGQQEYLRSNQSNAAQGGLLSSPTTTLGTGGAQGAVKGSITTATPTTLQRR